MVKTDDIENTKKEKPNFFEIFTEVIGWIQIVASPLLLSGFIGFLFYVNNPTTSRLIFAISITAAGLIFGIIWATKVWKKRGTINFVSRISASPELDKVDPL